MKTTEAARGHWPRLLQEIGGFSPDSLDGKHHACPKTGEGRDRFRFDNKEGRGTFFCACGAGDGMDLLRCCTGKSFQELAREIDEKLGNKPGRIERQPPTFAERLRARAVTVPRSAYLASRGLEVAPGLQFARGVEYFDQGQRIGRYDAMLAPVTREGKFITYHCTYLQNGQKAPVPSPRKLLPGLSSPKGGGVELYPADVVMGVAEGVETAIAARLLFDLPVHAALNTSLLAKWCPPAVARRIRIFADHDSNAAGHAAAWMLCFRLRRMGLHAEVVIPDQPDTDWNDVLLQARRKAA